MPVSMTAITVPVPSKPRAQARSAWTSGPLWDSNGYGTWSWTTWLTATWLGPPAAADAVTRTAARTRNETRRAGALNRFICSSGIERIGLADRPRLQGLHARCRVPDLTAGAHFRVLAHV